jgi:hypothetical protein
MAVHVDSVPVVPSGAIGSRSPSPRAFRRAADPSSGAVHRRERRALNDRSRDFGPNDPSPIRPSALVAQRLERHDPTARDARTSPRREEREMEQITVRRQGRMEPFINVGAFVVFALLWAAFAAALVWSQGSLDQTWEWIRSLPVILQGVVWLLFLPVVAGLWAWETTWPLVTRLIVVAGLGVANLYVFFPRSLFGGRV